MTVLKKLFMKEQVLVDLAVRNGLFFFFFAANPELIQADDIHAVFCCVIWQINAWLFPVLGQVSCDFV